MQPLSFPPVAGDSDKVLILGSMPGQVSLQQQQYYAHPRNSFWLIMCQLLNDRDVDRHIDRDTDRANKSKTCSATAPYDDRLALLQRHGVALWDVMRSCERAGSLDADIEESSIVANDFAAFYAAKPRLQAVYFNGAKAEQSYRRYVLPNLSEKQQAISLTRLPSTSPAHAAMSVTEKRSHWQCIREQL